jgi:alcohol dehydrogenase, propanol-preferring
MKAMVLSAPGAPLQLRDLPDPALGPGEALIDIAACGVCRTDLHVVDGDLPFPGGLVIPGHEIVGRVAALGADVQGLKLGQKVGVPWLGHTCGHCAYCQDGAENLCDDPQFTGYTRPGGFATRVAADAHYVFPLPEDADDVWLAPLLCAGLIGWRALKAAGKARRLGLYGFGAAAHLIAQVAIRRGCTIYAFTKPGDANGQAFARDLGAVWSGGSDVAPPELLDAAIIFAPVGALAPEALRQVRKGGTVVCAGIHMSDIPTFPYRELWGERRIVSVANLTRADGEEFFQAIAGMDLKVTTQVYPLERANEALADLREGRFDGAAVLVP